MADFSVDQSVQQSLQESIDTEDLVVIDSGLEAVAAGLGIEDSAGRFRILDLDSGQQGLPDQIEIVRTSPNDLVPSRVYGLGPGIDGMFLGGNDDVNAQGNSGDNVMTGSGGRNFLTGGAGNDTVLGGAGDDFVASTTGADSVGGGSGNDIVYGGSGNDTLTGGTGNDILEGASESDSLLGGDGNDYLDGGSEGDILDGGAGNDTLIGGSGNDTLTGGEGADVFVFTADSGSIDRITDFEVGVDVIQVVGENTTADQLVNDAVVSGSDTIIYLSDGSTITVVGVTGIDVDWFVVS